MKSGVYKITNTVSGRCYVGGSVNIASRWAVHRYALRRGRHHAHDLQADWLSSGEGAFSFEVLERVEPSKVLTREQVYLDELRPAYNAVAHAGGPLGFKHGAEMRRKMSEVHTGRVQTPEHRAARSVAMKLFHQGRGL